VRGVEAGLREGKAFGEFVRLRRLVLVRTKPLFAIFLTQTPPNMSNI
jgi:hypothetical protein